jgi:hypothetical protein
MIHLLAAVVLSGLGVPDSCQPQLRRLEHWTEQHAGVVRRPLETIVVPHTEAQDPDDAAWARPWSHPNTIWWRIDFLCTASDAMIEITLTHESFHLIRPDMSHEEIDNAVAKGVGRQAFQAYRAELSTAYTRMEEWRGAQLSRRRLYEPRYGRRAHRVF